LLNELVNLIVGEPGQIVVLEWPVLGIELFSADILYEAVLF